MDILAIIVNYNSADMVRKSILSIYNSTLTKDIKIVVVDNSADPNEYYRLQMLVPPEVSLINPDKNIGFSQACNLAYYYFESRTILLLNPDAVLLPYALDRLYNALWTLPRAGAVGPQIYWDSNHSFYLPPSYPPNLFLLREMFHVYHPHGLSTRLVSFLWRRFALKVWNAKYPVSVPALSGGHMLIKRAAVEACGGPLFDPQFFMYFEDTDLCQRLTKKGNKLYIVPDAYTVHTFNQCGGQEMSGFKNKWMQESWQKYQRKYMSGIGSWIQTLVKKVHSPRPALDDIPVQFRSPFIINLPLQLQQSWLFEWSPNPDFIPAAATFGSGEQFEFSPDLWKILSPGRYYGRLSKPQSFAPRFQFVAWEK